MSDLHESDDIGGVHHIWLGLATSAQICTYQPLRTHESAAKRLTIQSCPYTRLSETYEAENDRLENSPAVEPLRRAVGYVLLLRVVSHDCTMGVGGR